jgi:hypothetical protein
MGKKSALAAPSVSAEIWRELYAKAREFQELAPWEWMEDVHILGVNNQHGVRLISVLGAMEEVFGFASYRGSVGANYLLKLISGEISPQGPQAGFGQRALLLDFVPRSQLRKEDKAILQQIGFKPLAGKPQRYPEFYSHEPGYVPWFIDLNEARLLLDDLAKLMPFVKLLKEDPNGYDRHQNGEFAFFPETFTEPLTWEQIDWRVVSAAPDAADPPIELAQFDIASLSGLAQTRGSVWELSTEYTNAPIGEPPRPYWPKLGLLVDGGSGLVLGFKISGPDKTTAHTTAECLAEGLRVVQARPETVALSSTDLIQAVSPLLRSLNIGVLRAQRLPMTEEARASFMNFNRAGW